MLLYIRNLIQKKTGIIDSEVLQNQLLFVQSTSIEIISSLSDKDLKSELEPSRTPHPVAKTKFGAIDWNIKHTMWHCGQIGILKRIVHERFDFGLKQAK